MVDIGKKTKKIAEKLAEMEMFATKYKADDASYVRGFDAGLLSAIGEIRKILNENKKDSE